MKQQVGENKTVFDICREALDLYSEAMKEVAELTGTITLYRMMRAIDGKKGRPWNAAGFDACEALLAERHEPLQYAEPDGTAGPEPS